MGQIVLGTGFGLGNDWGDDPVRDLCAELLLTLRLAPRVTPDNGSLAVMQALGREDIDVAVKAAMAELNQKLAEAGRREVDDRYVRSFLQVAWKRAVQ